MTQLVMPLLWILPVLIIVLTVVRQLSNGMRARDERLRLDAMLGRRGSELVGVTDAASIRELGSLTSTEICAILPGLRLLVGTLVDGSLRVRVACGNFGSQPVELPVEVIPAHIEFGQGRVVDTAALDAAVGVRIDWMCMEGDAAGPDAWYFVGAPRKVLPIAVPTVRRLLNQQALALRTSSAHHALATQAHSDSLTGLANRASFTTTLASRLAESNDAPVAVLSLGLDDLKSVKDTFGHQAGDDLLVEVAARLRRFLLPGDVCARISGDEFAVLLSTARGATEPDPPQPEPHAAEFAGSIARQMVEAVAEPIQLDDRTVRTSAYVGMVVANGGSDAEGLMHQADVAMYAAKAHDDLRIELFTPSLLKADESRRLLDWQLAAAAAAGEFVVHYQPILSLPDLQCVAVEALVRWQHPELGLIQPGGFIEAAERTGAIIEIGQFVLEQACADVASWQRADPGLDVAVHVNVSAKQLDDDLIIDTVGRALAASGLPAEQLVLELTETVVLDSTDAIDRLQTLAAGGVKIAIDDFGTGYATLTTLRSLPVSILKLDKTFITGALTNRVDRSLIESIVHMSTQLGLQTVAEGVEHREEQQLLREVGIDAVQGYFYLRPVPASEIVEWLGANSGRLADTPLAMGDNVYSLKRPSRLRER